MPSFLRPSVVTASRRLSTIAALNAGLLIAASVAVGATRADQLSTTKPLNVTGTWAVSVTVTGSPQVYPQSFDMVSLSGSLYGIVTVHGNDVGPITGTLSGSTIHVVTTYQSPAGYVATFVGTVGAKVKTMSGTWKDTSKASGKWTATLQTTGGGSQPSLIAYSDLYVGSAQSISVAPEGGASGVLYLPDEYGSTNTPEWAPNGLTLAFEAYDPPDTPRSIFLSTPSGRIESKFPVSGGSPLAWSPNGKTIAYACYEGKVISIPYAPPNPGNLATRFPNVCLLNVVTGVSTLIGTSSYGQAVFPTVGGEELQLTWNPNGKSLLIDGMSNLNHGQCTSNCSAYDVPNIAELKVGATGGAPVPVIPFGDKLFSEPSYSPNGKMIALAKYGDDAGIYVEPAAGGSPTRISIPAPGQTVFYDPAWSPDSKDIIYQNDVEPTDAGYPYLYMVSAKGGPSKHAIAAERPAYQPSWAQPQTQCLVPKVIGQTLTDGTRLVNLSGCGVGHVAGPTKNQATLPITAQAPPAGTKLPVGSAVTLTVSSK